jgi:two-component system chemotaxis response regulator CheB
MDPSQNAESVIREDFEEQEHDRRNGELTMFTCPDCGGSLWQANAGNQLHFQCHVGHAWGPEALVRQKSEELEAALWSSVRLFEERATLSRQVGARLRASGEDQGRIDRIAEQALFDERRANAIREVLDAPLHGTVTILENGADGH